MNIINMLKTLGLKQPMYRLAHRNGCDIKMIAIDSSGLKYYGQDEWVREKYGEISEKRNWRKLHVIKQSERLVDTKEFWAIACTHVNLNVNVKKRLLVTAS